MRLRAAFLLGPAILLLAAEATAAPQAPTALPPPPEPPPSRAYPRPPLAAWTPEPPPAKRRRWYGWQTLIGLAVADQLLIGGGFAAEWLEPISIGFVARPLIAPVIHWSHGHVGKGFGSLALNVGGPFTAGLLLRLAFDSDRGCGLVDCVGFGVGVVLGVLVAPIIDIAALSTEEAQAPASETGIRLPSLSIVPISGAGRKGLALAGQF